MPVFKSSLTDSQYDSNMEDHHDHRVVVSHQIASTQEMTILPLRQQLEMLQKMVSSLEEGNQDEQD